MAERTRTGRLRAATVVSVAAAAVAAAALLPRAAPAQDTLRVAAYNIKHGRGMDGQVDLERLARVIGELDADVVTLQEVDRGTQRTGGVDQPAVLGALTGMTASFGAHRPYQGGEYGNAVLTRLPILEERTRAIAPSGGSALTVHEVIVGVGEEQRPVSVVSVHLAGSPEERLHQVDSLRAHFADVGHPVILAGDFNSRPGDPVLERLGRDWAVAPKEGPRETFPSDAPDREIDFVLLRPAGAVEVLEHTVAAELVASDHRPILAVLRIH